MKEGKRELPLTEHEEVYHAASRCQAAALSLTARRLHGLKKACSGEGEKTARFFAAVQTGGGSGTRRRRLRRSSGVGSLCRLEGLGLIGLPLVPQGKNDPDPHIGQGPHGDAMTFPLTSLALVVGNCPGFGLGALPGELVEGIAQGFDAAKAPMGFGILATLKQDGRSASQSLQTGRVSIAAPVIPDLGQQARGQTLTGSRQAAEDIIVFMRQKKGLDLLVVGSDLFDEWQQLGHQRQHQARLRAGGDHGSQQLRLMQGLKDLGSHLLRGSMPGLFERLGELVARSSQGRLWSRIALQEEQCRTLLQFGEQAQGGRVVFLEAGGELVHQARLHLDQGILVARQGLEFGHDLAIRCEPAQVRQVSAARLGEQIGIDEIGLGPGSRSTAIHGARIHRIHRPARLQQVRDEQPMGGLDNAGHELLGRAPSFCSRKAFSLISPSRVCSTRSAPSFCPVSSSTRIS